MYRGVLSRTAEGEAKGGRGGRRMAESFKDPRVWHLFSQRTSWCKPPPVHIHNVVVVDQADPMYHIEQIHSYKLELDSSM